MPIVRLLDLEPSAAPIADAVSGPVAFSSPAIGTFGPPVEPVEPPRDARPHTPERPAEQPPGRGRRKVSCTVTLTIAAALAAVTIGAGFLLDLWPSHGSDGDAGDVAARPPAAESTVLNEVPKAFVGTWKGPFDVEFAGSKIPAGTFSVVVGPGKAGAKVGTVTQFDALGNFACEDRLVLRSATATQLVADGTSSGKEGNHCTPGTHSVKLKLNGARLEYTSEEPRAGNPRALLDRAD